MLLLIASSSLKSHCLSSLSLYCPDYGEVVFVILSSRQRYNTFNIFKSEDIGDRLLVLEQRKKTAWHREIAQHTEVRGWMGRRGEKQETWLHISQPVNLDHLPVQVMLFVLDMWYSFLY